MRDILMVVPILLVLPMCCLGQLARGSLLTAGAKATGGSKATQSKTTTKTGKTGKQSKVRYCKPGIGVRGSRYECPTDSFTSVDTRVTYEMVELCEAHHAVEIRRSFLDGSEELFNICPAVLRHFDYGVEFDRGPDDIIYMAHLMNGYCALYGDPLKKPEGGKCDTDYDCGAGLHCSPAYQCELDGEDETSSPSSNPTASPVASPSIGPTSSQPTSAPSRNPSHRPTCMPSSSNPSSSPTSKAPTVVSTPKPTRVGEESSRPSKSPIGTGGSTKAPVATTTTTTTTTSITTTTTAPTSEPSAPPSTASPSQSPFKSPSKKPSSSPTTNAPSTNPISMQPMQEPSRSPTPQPSRYPVTAAPTQQPTIPEKCETSADCDACTICNSLKQCVPPTSGCKCDSNCPADEPKCYSSGGALGQCGCDSDSQCSGNGETCDYSCVISEAVKFCATPESRNEDCEGINGPGYICPSGGTKCTNPPSPTPLPTPRPIRPR